MLVHDDEQQMRQYAPFPHELAEIVAKMSYRPGWTFTLEDIERDPADGERPFSPTHGPGDDPYVVHDYATDTQKRTSFRGVVTE